MLVLKEYTQPSEYGIVWSKTLKFYHLSHFRKRFRLGEKGDNDFCLGGNNLPYLYGYFRSLFPLYHLLENFELKDRGKNIGFRKIQSLPIPKNSTKWDETLDTFFNWLIFLKKNPQLLKTASDKVIHNYFESIMGCCIYDIEWGGYGLEAELMGIPKYKENISDLENLAVVRSLFEKLYNPETKCRNVTYYRESYGDYFEFRLIDEKLGML